MVIDPKVAPSLEYMEFREACALFSPLLTTRNVFQDFANGMTLSVRCG